MALLEELLVALTGTPHRVASDLRLQIAHAAVGHGNVLRLSVVAEREARFASRGQGMAYRVGVTLGPTDMDLLASGDACTVDAYVQVVMANLAEWLETGSTQVVRPI